LYRQLSCKEAYNSIPTCVLELHLELIMWHTYIIIWHKVNKAIIERGTFVHEKTHCVAKICAYLQTDMHAGMNGRPENIN
jgi:hypothetical protein